MRRMAAGGAAVEAPVSRTDRAVSAEFRTVSEPRAIPGRTTDAAA
jgi:hypothetical protein